MQSRVVVTRSLEHELRFICSDEQAFQCLQFVDTRPAMPATELSIVEIDVKAVDEGYSLSGPDILREGAYSDLLDMAHSIIRHFLLIEVTEGLLLHAASMNVCGQNILLVGEKSAGKTTLALSALGKGHQVFGDEHVFINDTCAMTRPRTLRIKETSIALLPELEEKILNCRSFTNWDGSELYSYEPSSDAFAWHLEPYDVDHLIHICPNHGGQSYLKNIDKNQMFPIAMEQSFLPPDNQGHAIACLWNVLGKAALWQLDVGDLETALNALKSLSKLENPSASI